MKVRAQYCRMFVYRMSGFIFTCSVLLGILPFGTNLKYCPVRGCLSFLWISTLTTVALSMRALKLRDSLNDAAKVMIVKTVVENGQYIAQIVFVFVHTSLVLVNRKKIQRILRHSHYNSRSPFDTGAAVIVTVLSFIKGFPGAINNKLVYYVKMDEILSAVYVFLSYLILLQFCSMVRSVTGKIRTEIGRIANIEPYDGPMKIVPRYIRLMGKINEVYNVQMLCLSAQIFQYIVSSGYIVLSQVLIKKEIPFFVFPNLMNVIIRFAMLYSLVTSTGLAQKEVDSFNKAFFKRVNHSSDLMNSPKPKLFLAMNHSVDFTACRFFSLKHSIVTSIISSATTYLVVLLEFSKTP